MVWVQEMAMESEILKEFGSAIHSDLVKAQESVHAKGQKWAMMMELVSD
jgi:hypothetical protein